MRVSIVFWWTSLAPEDDIEIVQSDSSSKKWEIVIENSRKEWKVCATKKFDS